MLLFTGWFPTPENPFQFTFTHNQLGILYHYFNTFSGDGTWSFRVWQTAGPTDWPNILFRRSRERSKEWMVHNGIPVYNQQAIYLWHRLPIDQFWMTYRAMERKWKQIVRDWGGNPDIIWAVTLTNYIEIKWFLEKIRLDIPVILQEHSIPLTMHLNRPEKKKSILIFTRGSPNYCSGRSPN